MNAPKPPPGTPIAALAPAAAGPAPKVLAKIAGPQGELRLEERHYQGARFYWLQRWPAGADGIPRPDPRRGLSIKVREVGPLVAALIEAQRASGTDRTPTTSEPSDGADWLAKFHQRQDRGRRR